MPKAEVVDGTPRRRAQRPPAELANAVEGQIAEICCDLAVSAKRMQQLREQADELRTCDSTMGRRIRRADLYRE